MTEREVSSESADAAFLRGMALAYATDDDEHSQKGAARLREIADNILALRSSAKTGMREAFRAGWRVNAATPEEDEAGSQAYFDRCEEVDWKEYNRTAPEDSE